jgi:hypothetical protein
MSIKSWLGQIIDKDQAVESAPLVITPRHDLGKLQAMTKKELLIYAREHSIAINSRKRKEEIVTILMRN